MHQRLAILTSGGDAPGMNAALRAATLGAIQRGWTVIGVQHGYKGLIEADFRQLDPEDVSHLVREGGTILGSARCLEFHERAGRDVARQRLAEARIESLLVIGGNGSLTGANRLAAPEELGEQVLNVIGVPASIDNDVGLTSMAIGVDTAMNTIVEACDKITDTASAHDRTFVVEVMGRDCGYLAMATSVAAGAQVVLFRESGKDPAELVAEVAGAVKAAQQRDDRHVLVIKAEGVNLENSELRRIVEEQCGAEVRITVLGHVVRGGRPSAFDRLMASRLGYVAARAAMAGETRQMIAWTPPRIVLPDTARRSELDPRCWLVPLDEMLAETRRVLDGTSPVAQWRVKVFDEIEDVLRL